MYRHAGAEGIGWLVGSVHLLKRILIADDHELSRSRLVKLFKERGWEICAAVENGKEAVEKAIELSPDLIILDVGMPVMDGIEATRRINRALPSIPILIYTLHASSQLDFEAKNAGARQAISKADVYSLLSAVSMISMEQSRSQAAAGAAGKTS